MMKWAQEHASVRFELPDMPHLNDAQTVLYKEQVREREEHIAKKKKEDTRAMAAEEYAQKEVKRRKKNELKKRNAALSAGGEEDGSKLGDINTKSEVEFLTGVAVANGEDVVKSTHMIEHRNKDEHQNVMKRGVEKEVEEEEEEEEAIPLTKLGRRRVEKLKREKVEEREEEEKEEEEGGVVHSASDGTDSRKGSKVHASDRNENDNANDEL